MRVLGIDPGIGRTGIAVIDGSVGQLHFVHAECLETMSDTPYAMRLSQLYDMISYIIGEYSPEAVAIEKLFFATNRKTAMQVSEARGVIMVALSRSRMTEIFEYTPLQVKESIVGYGNARKQQVALMTQRLLRIPRIPGNDDAADACAIAICHHHRASLLSMALSHAKGDLGKVLPIIGLPRYRGRLAQ